MTSFQRDCSQRPARSPRHRCLGGFGSEANSDAASTCSPSCCAVPRQQLHQDTGCASSIDTSRFHRPSRNTCFLGRASLSDGQRWLCSRPWLPPPSPPPAQTLPRSERFSFPAAPLAPPLMCRLCRWTADNRVLCLCLGHLSLHQQPGAKALGVLQASCPHVPGGSWALPSSERPGRALGVFERREGVGSNTRFCRTLLLLEYSPRSRLCRGSSWYRGAVGCRLCPVSPVSVN